MEAHPLEVVSAAYPKEVRLRVRRNFSRVEGQGKRRAGKFVAISFIKKTSGPTRLGITVTKRYGKAHDRNRFKRIVREAFRLTFPQLPAHVDFVVKPRNDSYTATPADIGRELLTLFSGV